MSARLLAIAIVGAVILAIAAPAVCEAQAKTETTDAPASAESGEPTKADDEKADSEKDGGDVEETTGYKIGLAVGRVVPILLIVGLFLWYLRRARSRNS